MDNKKVTLVFKEGTFSEKLEKNNNYGYCNNGYQQKPLPLGEFHYIS